MLRGVAGALGGRIADAVRPRLRVKPMQIRPGWPQFRRRVVGQTIVGLSRVGKRAVLELGSGDRVVIEPRMTGLLLPADPPNGTHLRLVLRLDGAALDEVLFWDQRGLGVITLLRPVEFAAQCGASRLGPDALTITLEELRQRLGSRRRPVKVALMDQQFLVGVGNLYASEILHQAGIDPRRPCCELRPAQWRRIHAAMQAIFQEAIRLEGSTLADGTYRMGRDQIGGYQTRHQVYQRAGTPCPRCRRGEIQRIIQAQRSTFFCARCQR